MGNNTLFLMEENIPAEAGLIKLGEIRLYGCEEKNGEGNGFCVYVCVCVCRYVCVICLFMSFPVNV